MFRMTHHEKLVERYEDALFALMEKGWIVKVTGYNISKEDMLRISESVEIR